MVRKLLIIGILALAVAGVLVAAFYLKGPAQNFEPITYPWETAEPILWESMNGPPGGRVGKLVQSSYNHNILYATERVWSETLQALYKSDDRGDHWKEIAGTKDINIYSIAAFDDKLLICSDSTYYLDGQDNLVKTLDMWCNEAMVSGNNIFLTHQTKSKNDIRIYYTDLASGKLDWKELSISESELKDLVIPSQDAGFDYSIRVPNVVAVGNRLLANVFVEEHGSGQFSNGYLYVSEDFGGTWSKANLDKKDDVIISNIVQDPKDPQHIFLLLKHNIMHEFKSPISTLVKESNDGGRTWHALTTAAMESNGITDIGINGSTYYLLCPFDSYMLKLDGSGYQQMNMPVVKDFEGVPGFQLETILFDYDDPNTVYGNIGPVWSLGMLKSKDGMKTWEKMDNDIVASSRTIVVTHPTDSNTIFTSGNIIQESYLTRDWGKTWEPFVPTNAGDEVRVDPHDPDHIIAVTEMTYLFESYDGGKMFKGINQDFTSAKVLDFEIAKDDPEKIYASNLGLGISKNLGNNDWRYIIGSPDYVYDFELDPGSSDVLYAANSPKIFEDYSTVWRYSKSQSENFGWTELWRFEDTRGITSLKFDPSNSNKLYAGVIGKEGTVYVSRDKGVSWDKLNDDLTFTTVWGHTQLQIDPTDKKTVYAGTWGGGSYKTTDGGNNWEKMDEQHTFSPTCLAISAKDPKIIYACDRTAPKIHKSIDAGKTWAEYYNFGGDYMLTSAVAIDPEDPDTIYAAAFMPPMAHSGKMVKITHGQAVQIGSDLPRSVIEIEIDPKNRNVVYVSTHIHGVYKSSDGGSSWEKLDDKNGLPRIGVYDIDVDPTNSEILYATALCGPLPDYMLPPAAVQALTGFKNLDPDGKCGVYKSTDQGKNWQLILATISEARGIDINPKNNNNLYVADMMGGVWVSNDAGKNWKQENSGLGSTSMTSVKIKDNYIYASTQGSGVYSGTINNDGSITWDKSRSNKPKAFVYKIQVAVDPSNPDRIYASSYPGGLLRSDDGGKHWNDKNFLTPSIKVDDPLVQGYYFFDIDPNNTKNIWLGAYGKGVFVSYDGMDFDMFANGADNIMADKHITSLKINPANSNEVYVGTQEGVFVTKDGGKNWEELNDGLQTRDIRSLRIEDIEYQPFNDDFTDGNADNWELDSGWSVAKDDTNYVLQGTGHKFARAGSEGWSDYTFESRVKLVEGGLHVNFRLKNTERYFVGLFEGSMNLVRMLTENNAPVHTNVAEAEYRFDKNVWYTIKIVGKGSNIKVYVNDELKIDYTDDTPVLNGRIGFESVGLNPETAENSRIYVDDVHVTLGVNKAESVIYAGTGGYGIYSNPSGNKWENLGRTLGSGWWSPWERRMYQFSSIMFDPDTPGKVYYGHFPGGFFISEDNGKTWKDSSLGLGNDGIFSLSIHPNRSILFAGTYNGVAKSEDRGKTWKLKSNGMPSQQWPYTVAVDSNNPSIMYASTKNGQNKGFCWRNDFCGVVMKSTDGGESWFKIMSRLNDKDEFYTLLIYPPNHDILFLSTNRGVYMSRDAGKKWKPINQGLPNTDNQVRDNVAENLALTPDNKYLILGLVEYGLWKADLSKL